MFVFNYDMTSYLNWGRMWT